MWGGCGKVYGVSGEVCWRVGKGCGERNGEDVGKCVEVWGPNTLLIPHISLPSPFPTSPLTSPTPHHTFLHLLSYLFPHPSFLPHSPTYFPTIPTHLPSPSQSVAKLPCDEVSVAKLLWRSYHVAKLLATIKSVLGPHTSTHFPTSPPFPSPHAYTLPHSPHTLSHTLPTLLSLPPPTPQHISLHLPPHPPYFFPQLP